QPLGRLVSRSLTMRSILVIALLIASSTTRSISPDETDQEAFDREFPFHASEDDWRHEQPIGNALRTLVGCKDTRWECEENCHARIPIRSNGTGQLCKNPDPDETCFGQPIDYRYVPSRDPLPAEYEALRRYPKCWSVLGPMMCALVYRPCRVYEFHGKNPSAKTKMEMWQRFGVDTCKLVHELCADIIREGNFPLDLIDCKHTAEDAAWLKEKTNVAGVLASYVTTGTEQELQTIWERETAFTENCNIRYSKNASHHEPMQCMFPLVYTTHEKIRPVIDQCFLPCRNSLISSPVKFLSFRVLRAVLCLFFATLCSSIFIFLSARSKIFASSHAIFSITCCLLCLAVHLALWGLGSFSYFAELSECTRTTMGVNIRSAPFNEIASTLCIVSAVVQHVSLLCSIGFLAAAYPLSAASAARTTRTIRRNKNQKIGENSGWFRAGLVLLVIVVSSICGITAVLLKMVSTDGASGVCAFGLHSIIDHLTTVAFPGLIFCLVALAVGSWEMWREKKQREKDLENAIEERLKEEIHKEKETRKQELCENRDPHFKARNDLLNPVESRTGEFGRGAETERDGEDDVLVLERDCDSIECRLTEAQKEEISEAVRMEKHEEWRVRDKKESTESIPRRYTLVALYVCMVSLLIGVGVHWISLANSGRYEHDAVRGYMTCVVSKSIARKDVRWLYQPEHAAEKWTQGRAENDPLERRHNLASEISIHDCSLPSTGNGRLLGLLAVFILLPLLPVAVFIAAFGAGLAGVGGMAGVKERRPTGHEADEEKGEEMVLITTATAGDSPILRKRMLVSVPNDQQCSSDSDQVEWVPRLQKFRAIFESYVLDMEFSNAASAGMVLSAQAINLGQITDYHGTQDCPINYQVLDCAHERLQKLSRYLDLRIVTSDVIDEMKVVIAGVDSQVKINQMPNARECLAHQFSLN
ncbi:hypothetical protein PENTCL1PPCAC_1076, partial [Pristionchus entomophagus]